MAQTPRHIERFGEIDNLLRTDDNNESFLTPVEENFRGWYPRLLSTFALLTDGETLEYAEARFNSKSGTFVLFTDKNVVVATVSDTADNSDQPSGTAVPRKAIRSLSVSASMAHDLKGSRAVAWPGKLMVSVVYDGLADSVVAQGDSYDRNTVDHVGAIAKLLEALRADLKAGAADAA